MATTRPNAVVTRSLMLLSALLATIGLAARPAAVSADHIAAPTSVTIAGTLQSELGCPGDWQPDCAATHLTYDATDDVWQQSFSVPAGSWEYKAPLNDSWTVNYGRNAAQGGANIPLTRATAGSVKFYYDHKSHWVTDSTSSVIGVAVGSFQSELGCPGDWQPDCLRSWLQDPDGDGTYRFTTTALAAGTYEAKVAINEGWAENYGSGGTANGSNIAFTVPTNNKEVLFSYNATSHVLEIIVGGIRGDLAKARAHWLTRDTLAWNVAGGAADSYRLVYSAAGGLTLDGSGVAGGQSIALTYDPAGLSDALKAKFPHLAGYAAFKIAPADLDKVPAILKGQVAVAAAAGADPVDATGVQIPGVLDDLYTYSGPLGVSFSGGAPTLRVWAPTATSVKLHRFADPTTTVSATVEMVGDPATGVWSAAGDASWAGQYYLYEVRVYAPRAGAVVSNLVTDPYSLSLSANSTRSQIIDLNDPALKPAGWDAQPKPQLAAPEDIVLYELHVRDFSANDATVPANDRGTFRAFAAQGSDGMQHLRRLAQAGLTHVHILPAFDCASIDENKASWQQPDVAALAALPPDAEGQQAAVRAVRDQDGFNWCYDPYHYTVPEGSYSTSPDGPARIREFREMVQGLNRIGLRVVMDVVYNHTAQSGQDPKSVLDKVVPGYYHRLNADGAVETSTCCQNTASEHAMMEKLMVDSLVTWATAYKVDGFRFDLMGHHMKANMLRARDALRALTPAEGGVNGAQIYLYGEGWDFGEVANNARGVNATQRNMAGTGIGSFNDRIRDAARGGGPFDGGQDLKKQGFASGLLVDPNDLDQGSAADQRARLLLYQDQLRVSLAGNLKGYSFTSRTGVVVNGSEVDYNGAPAGYTDDPQEVINYVEAHDNATLFDAFQIKAPAARTAAERARMHQLATDLVLLGQGVPFLHAGQEILRSKSFDPNSYNSGDWFNRLDWTYQSNGFGAGVPLDQESNWPIYKPLLANLGLRPSPAQIVATRDHTEEMLRIRRSSPLFRLRTAADIQERLRFLNTGTEQTPGLLVMRLSEPGAVAVNSPFQQIVVIFNANPTEQRFVASNLGPRPFTLHPVQRGSADPVVRTASYDAGTGTFTVPARTTAVFVQARYQLAFPVVRP